MNTFLIIYLVILLFEAVLSTILKYAWQSEEKWDEPFYNQKTEQERNSSPVSQRTLSIRRMSFHWFVFLSEGCEPQRWDQVRYMSAFHFCLLFTFISLQTIIGVSHPWQIWINTGTLWRYKQEPHSDPHINTCSPRRVKVGRFKCL